MRHKNVNIHYPREETIHISVKAVNNHSCEIFLCNNYLVKGSQFVILEDIFDYVLRTTKKVCTSILLYCPRGGTGVDLHQH